MLVACMLMYLHNKVFEVKYCNAHNMLNKLSIVYVIMIVYVNMQMYTSLSSVFKINMYQSLLCSLCFKIKDLIIISHYIQKLVSQHNVLQRHMKLTCL